jgi:hypothetical protein
MASYLIITTFLTIPFCPLRTAVLDNPLHEY